MAAFLLFLRENCGKNAADSALDAMLKRPKGQYHIAVERSGRTDPLPLIGEFHLMY